MPDSTAESLTVFGVRLSHSTKLWFTDLRKRTGIQGADVARVALEQVQQALGNQTPAWPIDISLYIRAASGRMLSSDKHPAVAETPESEHIIRKLNPND